MAITAPPPPKTVKPPPTPVKPPAPPEDVPLVLPPKPHKNIFDAALAIAKSRVSESADSGPALPLSGVLFITLLVLVVALLAVIFFCRKGKLKQAQRAGSLAPMEPEKPED